MKKIEDYLHLYLWCDVMEVGDNKGVLSGIMDKRALIDCSSNASYWTSMVNIKPILRPLSDMSEEEKKHIDYPAYQIFRSQQIHPPTLSPAITWAANQTIYLLSKHFDLFGLIEAGLAIDAKTLINTN